MTGEFEFIGTKPMNLRGRDSLVYSFKPGDITNELSAVVLKFPRLFKPVEKVIETPVEANGLLAEVTPEVPVVEANGDAVVGDPEVLTETLPDETTVESGLPGKEELSETGKVDVENATQPTLLTEVTTVQSDGLDDMHMRTLRDIAKPLGLKRGRISKEALVASIREARKNANP